MKRVLLTAAAIMGFALSAQAATYDCKRTNADRGGWVSERIILTFDAKRGTATVLDGFVNKVHKKAHSRQMVEAV
ncbi:MAG: hypothetical protein AAF755_03410 [Pseudomonadota bacterium]